MKQYTVYFSEPVSLKFQSKRWNSETQKWEDFTNEVIKDTFTFYSLIPAKKLIKANLDKYKSSCITKIWGRGWENLGEDSTKKA